MNFTTADLSDLHPEVQIADTVFQDFGKHKTFSGAIVTVKVFEDNVLIRSVLEEKGSGRILIIDGGGSTRCALVGGNLSVVAAKNGWYGLVVNGCIRDSDEIATVAIGIKALRTHPRRSTKGLHTGRPNIPVTFAGVTFRTGQWLYADADGMVIAESALI